MTRFRAIFWAFALVVVIAVVAGSVAHEAAEQLAKERMIARAAILGRWRSTVPGTVHGAFRLDFPATGAATCAYGEAQKQPSATVTYQIHQEALRTRMADIVRHRAAQPTEYRIWINHGPAALPQGQPWLGHLIGDGNILILSPSGTGLPTVLRRLGSA